MANKKRRQEVNQMYQRKAKEQQYQAATKHLYIFPIIALAVSVLVLLLLFVTFADVYQSELKVVESSVSGWSFVVSGFTHIFKGQYIGTNPDTLHLYGALVEPFYDFATEWCETVAILAVVTVIISVVNVIVQAVTIFRRNHLLNLVSAAVSLAAFVLLIVCYAKCIDMNNASIISDYCRNPACVIRSYAIFPALFALAGGVVSVVATVKYFQASKLLK